MLDSPTRISGVVGNFLLWERSHYGHIYPVVIGGGGGGGLYLNKCSLCSNMGV